MFQHLSSVVRYQVICYTCTRGCHNLWNTLKETLLCWSAVTLYQICHIIGVSTTCCGCSLRIDIRLKQYYYYAFYCGTHPFVLQERCNLESYKSLIWSQYINNSNITAKIVAFNSILLIAGFLLKLVHLFMLCIRGLTSVKSMDISSKQYNLLE